MSRKQEGKHVIWEPKEKWSLDCTLNNIKVQRDLSSYQEEIEMLGKSWVGDSGVEEKSKLNISIDELYLYEQMVQM